MGLLGAKMAVLSYVLSDGSNFYILFLTLLCVGGKNLPPDGFIIYLWHQNPQHSLYLIFWPFQVYKTLAFLVLDQNFWCEFLLFSENVRKKIKSMMTSHILAAKFSECVTFYRLLLLIWQKYLKNKLWKYNMSSYLLK